MKTAKEINEKIEKLKMELNNLPRTPINISVLTGNNSYYTDDELISTVIDVLNWVLEDNKDDTTTNKQINN